jgi:hypothetical protein
MFVTARKPPASPLDTAVLDEADAGLAGFVRDLDAQRLAIADAVSVLERVIAIERWCAAARLLLASRAAASERWRDAGERSAAGWLARTSGTTVAEAQRTIDTGKRLAELPATERALRVGRLSPLQTYEVAKTAADVPGAEERLLAAAAIEDAAGLRAAALAERARACADPETRHQKVRRDRYFRSWTDDEGGFCFRGRTTAEDGAFVLAAIERARRAVFRRAREDGRRERLEAYDVDALVELCRAGGDGSSLPAGAGAKVILRLDARATADGQTVFDDTVEVVGVGHAPAAILDRLEGAFWAAVLWDGVDVSSVVHLGRNPTACQVTALQARDGLCQALGCSRARRLEHDHERDWSRTHRTALADLVDHCRHHYALKTRRNWRLVPGRGRRPMVPPGHPDHPDHQHARRRDPP